MAAVWFALTVPTAAHELKLLADVNQKTADSNIAASIHPQCKNVQEPSSKSSTEGGAATGQDGAIGAAVTTSIASILTKTLEKLNVNDVVWSLASNDNYYQVTFPSGKKDCEDILQELRIIGIGSSLGTKLNVLPCTLQFDSQQSTADINPVENSDSDGAADTETDGIELRGSKNILESRGFKLLLLIVRFLKYRYFDDNAIKQIMTRKTEFDREKAAERGLMPRSTGRKFMESIKARLTVAQVVEGVRSSASLTFDFIMLVLLAAMLAAMGLVENSSVILVAAMLVSPMMGPILAGTFGFVIRDRKLQLLGVKNEIIGLVLCLSFGFIFGIIYGSVEHWSPEFWLTDEMIARGQLRSLWVGVLIALPSGAGVALSILGGNAGCLVGVAISASLLPPVVNAGLLWAVALTKYIGSLLYEDNDHLLTPPEGFVPAYSDNMAIEALVLGIVSLCLTLVNILCIVLMGIIVLKIKEVAPERAAPGTKRFWGKDIKEVRHYNATVAGKEAKDMLAGIQEELNAHLLKGNSGEDSEEWRKCVDEIVNDPVYRTVRTRTTYRAPESVSQMTWHATNGGNERALSLVHRKHNNSFQRSFSTPREPTNLPSMSFAMEPTIDEDVIFRGADNNSMPPSSPTGKKLRWQMPFKASQRSSGTSKGRFLVTSASEVDTPAPIGSSSHQSPKKLSTKERERLANLYDLDELVP